MTVIDWVLIVVWLGLTLGGFWKGAVRIIFGGGGLAAGLWLAVIAGADAQAALEGVIGIPWIAAVGGRVLLVQATGWGKSAVYWAATSALRAGSGVGAVDAELVEAFKFPTERFDANNTRRSEDDDA